MKIAVFLPNWIGDAVMASPAVRAMREHFRHARLISICKPYISGVFQGSPWFDEEMHLDARGPRAQRWLAVALQLRKHKIDLALLFPNSFGSAWVAWLAGCRRRVGYARYGRSPLLTWGDRLEPIRDGRGKLTPRPVIEAYNLLAEHVGCPAPSFRMEAFTTLEDERGAKTVWGNADFVHRGGVVALNPGAAFGAAKHWPSAYFVELARMLVERQGSQVLVLCGPNERDLARDIASRASHPRVRSLADEPLSLGLTKACLRRCDLLITTDSGPRHLAAAFDRPVLTLFGPTHIAWTETYYPKAVHLQKKVDCGPCQLRVCPLDHRCMKSLTPEDVFSSACELLRVTRPTRWTG